jgi:hypothetical protein
LHLAEIIVIGHIAQDGMLACLLADVPRDKPVSYVNKYKDSTPPTT